MTVREQEIVFPSVTLTLDLSVHGTRLQHVSSLIPPGCIFLTRFFQPLLLCMRRADCEIRSSIRNSDSRVPALPLLPVIRGRPGATKEMTSTKRCTYCQRNLSYVFVIRFSFITNTAHGTGGGVDLKGQASGSSFLCIEPFSASS